MSGMDAAVVFLAFLALVTVLTIIADLADARYQRYIDLQRNRLTRRDDQ